MKKYTTVPGAEPSIPKLLRTRQSSLDGPSDSEEREEPSSSVTDSYTSTTTRPARPTEDELNAWRSKLHYDSNGKLSTDFRIPKKRKTKAPNSGPQGIFGKIKLAFSKT